MYEITLSGTPYERGLQQGRAYASLLRELYEKCPTWLGNLKPAQVNLIRETMVRALKTIFPEMVDELQGISDGSGISFSDVCLVNFVSAIGSFGGCTNLVSLNSEVGPVLAKTSDIGDDYIYYCVHRVEPKQGFGYFSVSWVGCLWAELGMNTAGLAVGQSSGPTQLGQIGEGVPTLEYPRLILERCQNVTEAITWCKQTPMAGKGLNIALVDASGIGAIIEKSGTATAIRFPLASGQEMRLGIAPNSVYCTNIFLEEDMRDCQELAVPGFPGLTDNSAQRLKVVDHFLRQNPKPSFQAIENLLKTPLSSQGLCQQSFKPSITHFAYILLPREQKMVIYEGVAENRLKQKEYSL